MLKCSNISAIIYSSHPRSEDGAHRICAECDPRNTAARKLLEKVGMRREAHFRQNIYFHKDSNGDPVWKDTYVYALTESDRRGKYKGE